MIIVIMYKEGVGIFNLEIYKSVKNSKNSSNADLKSNLAGVYPAVKINFFSTFLV